MHGSLCHRSHVWSPPNLNVSGTSLSSNSPSYSFKPPPSLQIKMGHCAALLGSLGVLRAQESPEHRQHRPSVSYIVGVRPTDNLSYANLNLPRCDKEERSRIVIDRGLAFRRSFNDRWTLTPSTRLLPLFLGLLVCLYYILSPMTSKIKLIRMSLSRGPLQTRSTWLFLPRIRNRCV
jgi:hypothetical protein